MQQSLSQVDCKLSVSVVLCIVSKMLKSRSLNTQEHLTGPVEKLVINDENQVRMAHPCDISSAHWFVCTADV